MLLVIFPNSEDNTMLTVAQATNQSNTVRAQAQKVVEHWLPEDSAVSRLEACSKHVLVMSFILFR